MSGSGVGGGLQPDDRRLEVRYRLQLRGYPRPLQVIWERFSFGCRFGYAHQPCQDNIARPFCRIWGNYLRPAADRWAEAIAARTGEVDCPGFAERSAMSPPDARNAFLVRLSQILDGRTLDLVGS